MVEWVKVGAWVTWTTLHLNDAMTQGVSFKAHVHRQGGVSLKSSIKKSYMSVPLYYTATLAFDGQ